MLGRRLAKARLLLGILWACVESEVLNRVKVDIVAGQKTRERKDKVVNVDGYSESLLEEREGLAF